MPFASKAQARALFAKDPAVAKEFAAATPSIKALPEHKPGAALTSASRKRRRRRTGTALSGAPTANGGTITGASTSTTRTGY